MALAALRGCQAQLRAAYFAHTAAPHLTGARATRAGELADKAADGGVHIVAWRERGVWTVEIFTDRPRHAQQCWLAHGMRSACAIAPLTAWNQGEPAGVAARCDRVAQERCPDTDSGWLWCPADGWAGADDCSLFP